MTVGFLVLVHWVGSCSRITRRRAPKWVRGGYFYPSGGVIKGEPFSGTNLSVSGSGRGEPFSGSDLVNFLCDGFPLQFILMALGTIGGKQDYLVWFKNSYSYLERGVGGPHFKARSGPICLAASPGSCRPKAYYGWVKRSLAPSIHLFCKIHHKNKRKRKRSDIDQVALAQAISPYTHTFFDRYPRLLLLSLAIPAVPAIAPAIDLSIPPFPR